MSGFRNLCLRNVNMMQNGEWCTARPGVCIPLTQVLCLQSTIIRLSMINPTEMAWWISVSVILSLKCCPDSKMRGVSGFNILQNPLRAFFFKLNQILG